MLESEEYCHRADPNKCVATPAICTLNLTVFSRERLYFATGYGLIQCVKGLMSFEDKVRSIMRTSCKCVIDGNITRTTGPAFSH